MNSCIHGLTEADIHGVPTFSDTSDMLRELLIDGEVVDAHSAAFDIQVMRASAPRYDVELPDFSFACTRVFARRWFPGWPSYALTYCTRQLGRYDHLRYIGCVGADSTNRIAPAPDLEVEADPSHPLYEMTV
jgi:DNA polymerase III epsilon subunit-like protein